MSIPPPSFAELTRDTIHTSAKIGSAVEPGKKIGKAGKVTPFVSSEEANGADWEIRHNRLRSGFRADTLYRMPKQTPKPDDFDSPWKEALHFYLPAFLAFFFPDIYAALDWSRSYLALDKEFQKIARQAKLGRLNADKLFKVWLLDGSERWLLIHIEIQGEYDLTFPKRMFQYHIAAQRLYNQDVVSLALLCDENANWRPTQYAYDNFGSGIVLTFRIAKLIDWATKKQALATSPNPFAAVVLAHLEAIETRKDPEERGRRKLALVKSLYRQNWSAEDVRRLFGLIDWVLALPEEIDEIFWAELNDYEEVSKMQYVTSVERIGIQKGMKIGHEQGREQGLEQGLEQGTERGLREAIQVTLEAKFGSAGVKLLNRMATFDANRLREIVKYLQTAKTVEQVRVFVSTLRDLESRS